MAAREETARAARKEAREAAHSEKADREETVRDVLREAREAAHLERAVRDAETREEAATVTSAQADRECAETEEIPAGTIWDPLL